MSLIVDYATLRGVRSAYQSLPPYGPDFDVTPRGEAVMLAHNLPPSYTPFKGELVISLFLLLSSFLPLYEWLMSRQLVPFLVPHSLSLLYRCG